MNELKHSASVVDFVRFRSETLTSISISTGVGQESHQQYKKHNRSLTFNNSLNFPFISSNLLFIPDDRFCSPLPEAGGAELRSSAGFSGVTRKVQNETLLIKRRRAVSGVAPRSGILKRQIEAVCMAALQHSLSFQKHISNQNICLSEPRSSALATALTSSAALV